MNIFVTNIDPQICALEHCSKHTIKQILEANQMLCGALNHISGHQVSPYKTTHINHPCSIWARTSRQNWNWLYDLMLELEKEWQFRYNHTRRHKAVELFLNNHINLRELANSILPDTELTPFAQAMPNQYKNLDATLAYKNYINNEKRHLFNWGIRDIPSWVQL